MSKEVGNLGREEANMSIGEADPQPQVGQELKAEFEFELVGVLERRCGSKVDMRGQLVREFCL